MKKKDKGFRFYWEEDHKKGPEISIELPGFNKDEINVSIEGGFLNISAQKREKRVEKGKGFFRQEMFQSAFRRSMSLPEGINPADLEIKLEDGAARIKRKKKKALPV